MHIGLDTEVDMDIDSDTPVSINGVVRFKGSHRAPSKVFGVDITQVQSWSF